MKRNLLFTLLFSVIASFAIAQISIDPEVLSFAAKNGEEQLYTEIDITNATGGEIGAFWKVELAEDFPDDWVGQMCDINLCYGWGTYASSPSAPNMIADGETVKFSIKLRSLDFSPMNGATHIILKLYDDPEFTNEIASSMLPTTSTNNIDLDELIIFPNPTTDAFQIKNDASVSTVSIYNMVGRKVNSIAHSTGAVHNVSDLRTGMYLVRLEDENGKVIKAMRLSKR